MQKIASPQQLQAEIKAIMAFVHNSEKPDRQVVASKLRELANRVVGVDFGPPSLDNPQKDVADHLDFVLRGMTLSKPSMDGLKELRRDLRSGKAKAKDLKVMAKDLEFDLGQAKSRDKKKIEALATFLTNMAKKLA